MHQWSDEEVEKAWSEWRNRPIGEDGDAMNNAMRRVMSLAVELVAAREAVEERCKVEITQALAMESERDTARRWEYLSETIHSSNGLPNSDDLDPYGLDGWELVSCFVTLSGHYHCIFKRPKKES